MVNGAYFVASGEGVEVKYEKAYSIEPKSASFIDQITLNAGVLGGRSILISLSNTLGSLFFCWPELNCYWKHDSVGFCNN